MRAFVEHSPTLGSYWRSVILFGRNVAAYKFALAKALLELSSRRDDLVRVDELAEPFSRHLCEHVRRNPKQGTSSSSRFLDACRAYNADELSKPELIQITSAIGFNNVLDAFHIVNQGELPKRFFLDERRDSRGVRLTDNFFELAHAPEASAFEQEVEARWRLVETAWELGVSRSVMSMEFEPDSEFLVTASNKRRISVTSSRDALNGYQKGKCFHCFDAISIGSGDALIADVDHFFPHMLKPLLPQLFVDGIWNLVLACQACNRGHDGKFARVPSVSLLERLCARNEFLVASHHPLRETLMAQTGATEGARRSFLQRAHDAAVAILIHTWEPPQRGPRAF